MRLQSKRAIVTGGASGIGREICRVFAREGARVVIADIDEAAGSQTSSMIEDDSGDSIYVHIDVSSEESVANLISASLEFMDGIDIVVNSAAAFVFGRVEDLTDSDWDQAFRVNVIGAANVVAHAIPHLKQSGRGAVVNIASQSGFIAQPASIPYNVSKGALLQMSRCLALDLGQFNIRVNCISPGDIHTEGWYTRAVEQGFYGLDRDSFLSSAAENSFLKRVGRPEEVANVALYLASDEASFVTGANLVVDGGATV